MFDLTFEDIRLAIVDLWRHKMLIIFVTLFGLFAGLMYTSFLSSNDYYGATASVYSATYGSYEVTQTDLKSLVNYSDVVSSRKVAEYAASLIKETGITATEIQRSISIKVTSNSYVMEITTFSANPEHAIVMANAVAEAFVLEVSRVTGSEAIQILDSATRPFIYQADDLNQLRMLFPAAFMVMIGGYIGLRSLFSNRLKSISQCVTDERELLGILPYSG